MINNVWNYIYLFLNLQLLIKLYKEFSNYPNIRYSIVEIKKLKYKKLKMVILFIKSLNAILKSMIFINSINKKMVLIKYLYVKL